MDDKSDSEISALRSLAVSGKAPHDLAIWLVNEHRADFRLVRDFIATFRDAFDVPLNSLRDSDDLHPWPGYPGSRRDDHVFGRLLQPHIDSWVVSCRDGGDRD